MNISDLLKDPNKAKKVLEKAIEDKNKEAAEMLIPIVNDPELTCEYAEKVAKGKIKDEFEDIIAQDSKFSFFYSSYVLKDRFIKGEDVIAKNSWYSFWYAKDVLKDRFIKGEDTIINFDYFWDYIDFLKKINKLNEFLKDHPEVKDKL